MTNFTDDFCNCNNPNYEPNTRHEQQGGEIKEVYLGEVCTNCGLPRNPNNKLDD